MDKPAGLYYIDNIVSEQFLRKLTKWIESEERNYFPVSDHPNARMVIHYGYKYDYSRNGKIQKAPSMPKIIKKLRRKIKKSIDVDIPKFNQCIINRYLPGQGIGPHIDKNIFGEYIACFTVGGGAEMEFCKENLGRYCIYTEPGSLYVMSGESRHNWTHQMRSRKKDPNHGYRNIRYSITFRYLASHLTKL